MEETLDAYKILGWRNFWKIPIWKLKRMQDKIKWEFDFSIKDGSVVG
jgi:hypothetical protein